MTYEEARKVKKLSSTSNRLSIRRTEELAILAVHSVVVDRDCGTLEHAGIRLESWRQFHDILLPYLPMWKWECGEEWVGN